MDVSVIVRGSAIPDRIAQGLRPFDAVYLHDWAFRNIGFCAGHNANARKGTGALICFVNPDGDLTRECLDVLEGAFDDADLIAAAPSLGPRWDIAPGNEPFWLPATCLVVRREAFEEVGGFDERLFMYGEDVDLSWKLNKIGRIERVDNALFAHDVDGSRSFRSLHRWARNRLVVRKRHLGHAPLADMARGTLWDMRTLELRRGLARITGTADYVVRARYWA